MFFSFSPYLAINSIPKFLGSNSKCLPIYRGIGKFSYTKKSIKITKSDVFVCPRSTINFGSLSCENEGIHFYVLSIYNSPNGFLSVKGSYCRQFELTPYFLIIGQEVSLSGWLSSSRILSQSLAFLVIRDGLESIQAKVEFEQNFRDTDDIINSLRTIPLESIIHIKGIVNKRPKNMVKNDQLMGDIEIIVSEINLLNKADNLPIPYHRAIVDVLSEELLLKYRYLELRQPYLQRNLRLRSLVLQSVRSYLIHQGFCEIETPTLFRKTSEGAREYIVPANIKNKFYTLTQSPQQYKQLLMASGFGKYFQIARCYRNEDLRADRQPEFTQIDIEAAFVQKEDIQDIIEGLLVQIWKDALGVELEYPFIRRSYRWCIDNYGSDKPDTRFEITIKDATDIFKNSEISFLNSSKYICEYTSPIDILDGDHLDRDSRDHERIQESDSSKFSVKLINLKSFANNKEKNKIENVHATNNKISTLKKKNGNIKGPLSNMLSQEEIKELDTLLNWQDEDLIVLAAGPNDEVAKILGRIRLWYRDLMIESGKLIIPPDRFDFLWVVDFPLFTRQFDSLVSTHHPFTAPVPEDSQYLTKNPERIRGQHYDIVLNGQEIGGGSIRIHKQKDQIHVLHNILGIPEKNIKEFQHLIDALGHGCPPHGGIALGLDRLMATIVGAKSLREVIAFPKSTSGADLMADSPAELGENELSELLEFVKQANENLTA